MCRSPLAKWSAHILIFAIDCIARSASGPSKNATRHYDGDKKGYSPGREKKEKTTVNAPPRTPPGTMYNRDNTRYTPVRGKLQR